MSVNDRDKAELIEVAKGFYECGFEIISTMGSGELIEKSGIPVRKVEKLNEGRPNVLDIITNGEVSIVINTPNDKKGAADDSYIRKAVIKGRVPYMTTMAEAKASIAGIKAMQEKKAGVKSLQEFHSEIAE